MTRLADQFRQHFGHRDHLYGILLDQLADDLDAGGPTAAICRDVLAADRGDAVQLRLLAGIYRIVLRGEAPDLVPFYPALGGTADPQRAWEHVRPVLSAQEEQLRQALELPPQTNEVGRSACLIIALFEAVERTGLRQIRLLEPGASAGLNLNVDRYRFLGEDWSWGTDVGLTLDTGSLGIEPVEFDIVERRGCDLAPVDASTQEGAIYLRSFVWPFDIARSERLAAALAIARRHPFAVDRAPAAQWVTEHVRQPQHDDVLTVVWQSITAQYWSAEETAAVAAAIDEGRQRMPICHVTMEGVPPVQGTDGYAVERHGPELVIDGDVIARSHHHGPPVILV